MMLRIAVALGLVITLTSCSTSEQAPPPTVSSTPNVVVADPTPEGSPEPQQSAREFVASFMQARLDRDAVRADAYLGQSARLAYGDEKSGLKLTGDFKRWEIVTFDAADANSWEVQVRVYEVDSDFVEVLFVGPTEGRALAVRGARIG